MYKLINGWTKEMVMAQIRKYNNNSRAIDIDNDDRCVYKTADGNRCAIGCFIPDDHPAFNVKGAVDKVFKGGVNSLIRTYPDLANALPFVDDGASLFQNSHDNSSDRKVYENIQHFLDNYVE